MAVYVYNKNTEFHDGPNNYIITRPSILSNPYFIETGKPTRGLYSCKTREEAIEKYEKYFNLMYSSDLKFKKAFDEIYEKFKNGEDIYLGCVCKPLPCHGDIIEKKLTSKLVREKFLKKK